MRYNQLLIKTIKQQISDESAKNAQLLMRASFIDKLQAGVYTYLPLGLIVLNKISNIIRKHINALGAVEILMPALHNKNIYEATGRWDTMDSLIRFETYWTKSEYALGATHEEVISPLMKKYIQSYKNLPKYVYQIQTKFRDEKRAKSGILRGREFLMKDLYSFHTDEEDLDNFYNKVIDAYFKIYDELELKDYTYLTFASGGSFSKFSHEFQTACDAGEDTIYLCEKCKSAVNKEIIDLQPICPTCSNADLKQIKTIEVGNIFKLKTKYSTPFNLNYMDEKGQYNDVIMGCYGIGVSRLMGTIVEIFSDENGIIWPKSIAPFDVYLVGLNLNDENIRLEAEKLYNNLLSKNISVLYDDRIDVTAGEKFADADLIGCPIRITFSKKMFDQNKLEFKKRSSKDIEHIDLNNIYNILLNL